MMRMMRMEEKKFERIMERFEGIEEMIKVLIRQKMGDKEGKLHDFVRNKGRIDTKGVINFLNITRSHSLTLMKKLGKKPGFTFRVGNMKLQTSSLLMYNQEKILEQQLKSVDDLFTEKGSVRVRDIMDSLQISKNEAKEIQTEYSKARKNISIAGDEGNMLIKNETRPIK
jgi:hypothetical protein